MSSPQGAHWHLCKTKFWKCHSGLHTFVRKLCNSSLWSLLATYRKGNILDKNKTNITNEKIYRIELSNEEYNFLENLKNEFCTKLSKMTKEEITEYLKSFYPEQNLNFGKEIKGTVYKVNTYFNKDSEHTILTRFFEIFQK